METYTIDHVLINIDGKKVASLPEAVVNLGINRIEVLVDEVLLSNETVGLLELMQTEKEFEVVGKVRAKTIVVERAKVNRLTFDAKQGEAVVLRAISILALRARWAFEK